MCIQQSLEPIVHKRHHNHQQHPHPRDTKHHMHLSPSASTMPNHLSTETVERAPLSLKSIYYIQRRHCLSLSVFGVGDGIADDALEEGLEDSAGFFVDHCWWSILVSCWEHMRAGRGVESGQGGGGLGKGRYILAEIRLTPPRRARRRMAGLVIPWMLSRRILR